MKVFIAALMAETNSFSPIPTGDEAFAATFYRGDATQHPPSQASEPLHVWRLRAEAEGDTTVESICAYAGAGGTTARKTYERLRDEILDDLASALPVDIVLLHLHGAMSAHGYDDCEGDLLTSARALVGQSTVIGAELDLHCSLTDEMIAAADILIAYKESPHIDIGDRAAELYTLAKATAADKVKPVMALYDCRMISAMPTVDGPMAEFVKRMRALEGQDGVLSVSLVHGFAFSDTPDNGVRVLVIADGDESKAKQLAERLGCEVWSMREQTGRTWTTLEDALNMATASRGKPVVLADLCDNAGGGAPSDSTFILRALLDRGITDVASGVYWDPMAVTICKEAGEGADLELRIGGKSCSKSGPPVDLSVRVCKIIEDATQPFGTSVERMGDAVWVQAENGIDLVLASVREQTYHPAAFTQFGIKLTGKAIIVVKSSIHFRTAFEPIAAEILYPATAGLLSLDYTAIPYRKFTKPYWPKVANPFSD